MSQSFKVGDHVFVGKPARHKVHWEVFYISPAGHITLRSPMSGRYDYGHSPDNLTLHTPSTRIAKETVA